MNKIINKKFLNRNLSTLQWIFRTSDKCLYTTSNVATTTTTTPEEYQIKSYTNKKISYATTVTTGFNLIPDTIPDLIEQRAHEVPNKICYAFPHNRGLNLTYQELKQRVDTLGQSLLNMGFKKGDRLAVILPNTYEIAVLQLACASIGLVCVSMHPAYQLIEIEYMLKITNSKGVLIFDSFKHLQHLDIIRKICPELDTCQAGELKSMKLPDLKHVIVINSPLSQTKNVYKGTWSFEQLENGTVGNQKMEVPKIDIDDPFLILFTSGTTGHPKGVPLRQMAVINCANYVERVGFGVNVGIESSCVPIPLFHLFGFALGIIPPLLSGNLSVFPFFLPDTLSSMKAIQAYKCKAYMGPPTLFIDLLNHPERKQFDLSSLEKTLIGASTVPADLLEKMKNELKLKTVLVGYGLTETSLLASMTYPSDARVSFKHAYESIGRPIPFLESKIIDSNTNEIVPLNTNGELCLRGFNILRSYWNDAKKTEEAIDSADWFRTGDICQMDADGYLYFKSRSKDVIIRGGTNVYPAEVESFLRTHPSVIDVCVFGIPDKRFGEEIGVWIKLKPNTSLKLNELQSYCSGNIAAYKIPKYMKLVDSFPINPNGKIMRHKIIEQTVNDQIKSA